VGVGRFGEDGLLWWCRLNASILDQGARRRDEALSEDEADVASSSWFNGKEA
jgi:hypothetical protein